MGSEIPDRLISFRFVIRLDILAIYPSQFSFGILREPEIDTLIGLTPLDRESKCDSTYSTLDINLVLFELTKSASIFPCALYRSVSFRCIRAETGKFHAQPHLNTNALPGPQHASVDNPPSQRPFILSTPSSTASGYRSLFAHVSAGLTLLQR